MRLKLAKETGLLARSQCSSTFSKATALLTLKCSHIPEGTQTRIHFWSVHRDPRNFSHPDTFWPDRWLIAEGLQQSEEKIVHNPNAFTPFSFGPYNCVGKNIAMQEMRVLLCHFVQKLNFRFPDGFDSSQYEQTVADKFVFHVGRLPVVVESRE